jgi:hypothetical protein
MDIIAYVKQNPYLIGALALAFLVYLYLKKLQYDPLRLSYDPKSKYLLKAI